MNTYCIYRHTFPNGKVYIGLTCQNPLSRWQSGYGYKSQQLMFNAIKKYGWDNVRHEILIDGLTLSEAHKKEIEWISFHKSNNRAFGYNVSSGGESGTGCALSLEARKKIGAAHRGKPLSAEHREKLRIAKLGKKRGKFSPEVVERMMAAHAEMPKKPINQYTLDGVFLKRWETILRINQELRIAQANIIAVCKGKRKTAGGFVWAYAGEEGD